MLETALLMELKMELVMVVMAAMAKVTVMETAATAAMARATVREMEAKAVQMAQTTVKTIIKRNLIEIKFSLLN